MMTGNSNENIRSSTNQTTSLKITLAPSVHNEIKGSRRFSDDSNRPPREITILPAAQTDLHLTLGNNRAPFLSQKQNPRIDPNVIYRPENIENGDSTPTSPLDSDHVHDTVLIVPRENSKPGYNTSPPTNSDVGLKTFTKRTRNSEQTGSSGLPDGLNKCVDSKPNQGNASFPETSHPVQSQNTRSNGEIYKGQSRPFEAVETTASAPPKKVAYVQLQPTRAVPANHMSTANHTSTQITHRLQITRRLQITHRTARRQTTALKKSTSIQTSHPTTFQGVKKEQHSETRNSLKQENKGVGSVPGRASKAVYYETDIDGLSASTQSLVGAGAATHEAILLGATTSTLPRPRSKSTTLVQSVNHAATSSLDRKNRTKSFSLRQRLVEFISPSSQNY